MNSGSSLILAAHGWPEETGGNQALEQVAEQIRNQGAFSCVRAAYVKSAPLLESVIESLPPGEVVVVPVMTSQGYYADQLAQRIAASATNDHGIQICPVVGEHPAWADLIAQRAREHQAQWELDPAETVILLVGHGTRRHARSAASTEDLAHRLSHRCPEFQVELAFLDQAPELAEAGKRTAAEHLIVVPFLIGQGPHLLEDIPPALGLDAPFAGPFPQVHWIQQQQRDWLRLCEGPLVQYDRLPELIVAAATGATV